ncbi:hypothetical protein [Shewanella sp. CG12_big_fil_rev_8_21_14_0_65_47_15]|uniref:hypothetical protein n=1 Tax=Shewanella sp. CG12_big_fil_rev_8_21_14_0_65_47_15 TaxID=1975537 RepID=UPI000CBDD323|nr:hypothetical protein [Shewanella sp. CG12_big_fil_rev_8_21_14_0_65_47_15]PIW62239.1 MAG: hypothetical protein COW15_04630 [Shewanella sp. CG12_big_fil_rev_8_21_14_0_65_47_15]
MRIHSNFPNYKAYSQFAAIPNTLNVLRIYQHQGKETPEKMISSLADVHTVMNAPQLMRIKAAKLIQQKYHSYQQQKAGAEINTVGIKSLTNAKAGCSYFYNAQDELVARTPAKFQPAGKGNFKQLVRQDSQFVQLHIYNDTLDIDKSQYNLLMMDQLKHHPSICPALYVNDSTMIAHNGGIEVAQLIEQGDKIPLIHFKSLLEDLSSLHNENIFLHDIKPANLTYKGTHVRHIDVENLFAADYNDGEDGIICTPEYTTAHLTNAIFNGDPLADQNHDNYSILLSMIEATSGDFFQQSTTGNPQRLFGLQGSALTRAQYWIQEHIKPEYQTQVEAFVKLPGSNVDATPLIDMINWK